MADIPQEYTDLLHTATLAHVATIGPKGEPQNTPVWFDWDGRHIRFSQTKTRQKFRNLARDPRLALSIVDPNNPYRSLEIRGKVVRIEEDPDLHFLNAPPETVSGAGHLSVSSARRGLSGTSRPLLADLVKRARACLLVRFLT